MDKVYKFGLAVILFLNSCSLAQNEMLGTDIKLFENTIAFKLATAVEEEDTSKIKDLCSENSKLLNFQEPYFGQTILQWAVYVNKFNAVKALLECGADPNIQAYDGTTALIQAADKSETSSYVKLLLNYGGNANTIAQPKEGIQQLKTPLIAAAGNNLESVKLLVEAGADINFKSKQDQSALHQACLLNKIEIVKYLIEKGANYREPITITVLGDTLYLHQLLRNMTFDLNSNSYKIKMEVAKFLKERGMDYWKTEIPKRFYDIYSKEYLESY